MTIEDKPEPNKDTCKNCKYLCFLGKQPICNLHVLEHPEQCEALVQILEITP